MAHSALSGRRIRASAPSIRLALNPDRALGCASCPRVAAVIVVRGGVAWSTACLSHTDEQALSAATTTAAVAA